jgi:hypothetical protein
LPGCAFIRVCAAIRPYTVYNILHVHVNCINYVLTGHSLKVPKWSTDLIVSIHL